MSLYQVIVASFALGTHWKVAEKASGASTSDGVSRSVTSEVEVGEIC